VTPPPFVTQLRARTSTINLATPGTEAITIRVEMPEVWDVVRIVTPPSEPVIVIKQRALEALAPESRHHENVVMKLRGWEILDESAPLRDVGVVDGSILLLTYRRRRPVR
jgi:hypothetical protein